MLTIKGVYKQGKIELLEPIEGISEADLYIVVLPRGEKEEKNAVLMDSGEVLEFGEWTEREMKEVGLYALMTIPDDSPEVAFDGD